MDWVPDDVKRRLLGSDIEEWRCPRCGAMAYTHKAQGALMVKCASDHGGALVWMVQVGADDPAPDADSYTPGQYRQARGIAPGAADAEPAHATIRRQREGE